MIIYFLCRCFLSSITAKAFTGLDWYICVTRRVSYKKQALFALREHMCSIPVIWLGPGCSSCYFFLCCHVLFTSKITWPLCLLIRTLYTQLSSVLSNIESETTITWPLCLLIRTLYTQLSSVLSNIESDTTITWTFCLLIRTLYTQLSSVLSNIESETTITWPHCLLIRTLYT
jgi:hypothetical protein